MNGVMTYFGSVSENLVCGSIFVGKREVSLTGERRKNVCIALGLSLFPSVQCGRPSAHLPRSVRSACLRSPLVSKSRQADSED